MKKFFSLIALAGVIAACTPEQIETAFKLAGAKGTIDVEVVKLNGDALEGTYKITGFEQLPGSSIAYNGNKATITFSAAESASINLTEISLTAEGEQIIKPVSTIVTVPTIYAGQVAKLSARIRVGETLQGWYFSEESEYGETESKIGFLANDHYATHAYTHGDITSWYVNNSEFMLSGTAQVPYIDGFSAGYNVEQHDYAGWEAIYLDYIFGLSVETTVDEWVEAMCAEDLEEGVIDFPFQVSAWAMWNIIVYQDKTPITAKLTATKVDEEGELTDEVVLLASVTYDRYDFEGGLVELPYPGAAGHYEKGHGHDAHGNGANAGGGISFNE